MGIFRRSLAQDQVDIYNHSWSVLFLLFLAIVTWLLPLSPLLQPLQPQSSPASKPMVISRVASPEPTPTFKATCWCPPEFTGAMVAYSQTACAGAYNLLVRGIDPKSHNIGADIYDVASTEQIPLPQDRKVKSLLVARKPNSGKAQSKQQKKSDNAWHFIHTKTPVALFLFAVFLKVPHLVWGLLSCLSGGVNIDQTLRSARAGARLDQDSRRQLHSDLAAAAAEKVRGCSWSAASLYLLFKILMCVAVLSELLVLHGTLLPQARALEEDLKVKPRHDDGEDMKVVNTTLNTAGGADADSTDYMEHSSKLLLCDLAIRSLQNVQHFTLQCVFQTEHVYVGPTSPQSMASEDGSVSSSPHRMLKLYETVYLVVLTLLAVLTVTNLASFLVWLLKLLAPPCRKTTGSDSDLSLDACLLLQMARENAGPEVVKALAQSGAWGRAAGGKECIALSE